MVYGIVTDAPALGVCRSMLLMSMSSRSYAGSRNASSCSPASRSERAEKETLLPYFAPFAILAAGEVFLMINGEIDLSIGAVYPFAPFLFYEIVN